MEREFKYRPPGIIFYLTLVISLVLSKSGVDLFTRMQVNADVPRALGALITAGILLFTSEGVGYIFSSIVCAVFNLWGGYSKLFQTYLSYGEFKPEILKV
jgi:hypothetical protein